MAQDIHQIVTDKIIATMEAGEHGNWTCPWHRTGGGLPRNALTGKAYRGINTLSLWVGAQAFGYTDDRWATYKQWGELGAQVRRGERSTLVVFFKDMDAEGENDRKRFVARASYAFNASQVDGAPAAAALPAPSDWTLPGEFERFFSNTGARITHGGDAAFYQPSEDRIVLPRRDRFPTAQGYAKHGRTRVRALERREGAPRPEPDRAVQDTGLRRGGARCRTGERLPHGRA